MAIHNKGGRRGLRWGPTLLYWPVPRAPPPRSLGQTTGLMGPHLDLEPIAGPLGLSYTCRDAAPSKTAAAFFLQQRASPTPGTWTAPPGCTTRGERSTWQGQCALSAVRKGTLQLNAFQSIWGLWRASQGDPRTPGEEDTGMMNRQI